MALVDHGVLRVLWTNMHRVSGELWRSNHPLPHRMAGLRRRGIRTVVNLRGRNDSGWYVLEAEACRRAGLELVDFPVKSRDTPARETVHAAKRLFATLNYPALLHCKSGADRAGLMSALYLLLHENRPLDDALAQLHWRYGHIRQAKVGMIDYFFAQYRRRYEQDGMPFLEWVDRVYDPQQVKATFLSQWWANLLVDKILRRE
jgi:protein tyrosine/serine phosphatase